MLVPPQPSDPPRACKVRAPPSPPQVIRVRALQSLLDAASDPARALGLTQRGKAAAHEYAVEIVKMEMAPQAMAQEGAGDGVPSSWRVGLGAAALNDDGPGAQATDETVVLEAARRARPVRPSEPRAAQVAAAAGGGTGSDSSGDEEDTVPRQPSG